MSEDDREAIQRHLNFSRNLHIETRILEGVCARYLETETNIESGEEAQSTRKT